MRLKKDLFYFNIADRTGDIGITINDINLVSMQRDEAKKILLQYNLIKENGNIILQKGLQLVTTIQHGGATEYIFKYMNTILKVDLAEIDDDEYFE